MPRGHFRLTHPPPWVIAAITLLLGGAIAAWWAAAKQSESRARTYAATTACLLTDAKGITPGSPAAPIWTGMQNASVHTHAKVQYLAIAGTDTVENTVPYLNTLAKRQCNVILATSTTTITAVTNNAQRFPDTTFIVVNAPSATRPHNVVAISTTAGGIQAAVDKAISDHV